MDNDKKFLAKKRQKESLSIENLSREFSMRDIRLKNELSKSIKSEQDSNLNSSQNKMTTLNDKLNNINNSKNLNIFTLGNNLSFNTENNSELFNQEKIINQSNKEQKLIKLKLDNEPIINEKSEEYSLKSDEEEDSKNYPNLKAKNNNTQSSSHNNAFGLKEISKRVKEIIKQNGRTTYKAISDQIVKEIKNKNEKDEKNIRRRIYDSLNVMKSMNLFKRDKITKTIIWDNEQELDPLNEIENKNELIIDNKIDQEYYTNLKKEIKEKSKKLELLRRELLGLKNVLERNAREINIIKEEDKLYFPFIVIELPKDKEPKIKVAINESRTKAHFGFDEIICMYPELDAVSKIGNHPNFSKSK